MAALSALEESSHRLVGRANLNLFEVGLVVDTFIYIRAKNLSFVDIFPSIFTSEHIVNFLALKLNYVFEGRVNFEYVGTRFAKEAEVRRRLLC